MMFLQFFIWGAWYTTIAVYMTHHGMETLTHWPYTVNPIAAIVAPFFLGLVADRYFATEKVVGQDRKSTRLNSSHGYISYAVFCLKKKNKTNAHKSSSYNTSTTM